MKNRKQIIEPAIHILIWICSYLFIVMVVKTIGPFKRVDHTLLMPVTLGTVINIILFYTTALILIPQFSNNRKTGRFLILLLALLTILTSAETLIDNAFFTYYYSDRQETVISQLVLNLILNGILLSLALAYGFTKNWFRNEKIRQELNREKLTAELNLLRTQLNPHFLFNVLNMAFSSASRNGDERTAEIIEKLSGLMRYTTYESNIDKIDLERETEYLQNYISLQKMRFSEDMPVKVNFDVEGDISGCRIPPLILIQFVENCFKHGIKLEEMSEIDIRIKVTDRKMVFSTRNPVYEAKNRTASVNHGIGIENVRRRLAILYPGKHELITGNDDDYFTVKLTMDLD